MVAAARSKGRIEAEATVSWAGWGGRVEGASGRLSAQTATQVELGGPGQGTNPEELLAAALANCYTSTITAHARAQKIELTRIETRAQTRLAWDAKTPHHIAQGRLNVAIASPAPEAELRRLAEEARDHCPICNLFGATAQVTLRVSVLKSGSKAK
ncbi:MAG TPA: OsmC family protein [Candidatus Udaeobacter sp.]|nr:OsmC family protein [Candidatus Udaeobacter sp.]